MSAHVFRNIKISWWFHVLSIIGGLQPQVPIILHINLTDLFNDKSDIIIHTKWKFISIV